MEDTGVRAAIAEVAASGELNRLILSKAGSSAKYRKEVIERIESGWKAERFTETQAFHEVTARRRPSRSPPRMRRSTASAR